MPPPAPEATPAESGLVVPAAVQVREADGGELDEDERVTDPGPANARWSQAARDEEEEISLRRATDPVGRPAVEPDADGARPAAAGNLLRARPRRAPLAAAGDARAAIDPDNVRSSPTAQLDTPLFSDEVFVRPAASRPRPETPPRAPRSWPSWVVAALVILGLVAVWSSIRS